MSGLTLPEPVTERASGRPETVWRYCLPGGVAFDPVVFDEQRLAEQGLLCGAATAGRGNTFFFQINQQPMVLRHYRRGGLAQRLSKRHYLFTGLEQTRAMREFDVLVQLQREHFAAPVPYACQVVRQGLFYTASLVTHRIAGQTLAEKITAGIGMDLWRRIGLVVAQMHKLGYYHADLNAHNILVQDSEMATGDDVSIIDFDRSYRRSLPAPDPATGWCFQNTERLKRSLTKISAGSDDWKAGFAALKEQWLKELSH